MDTFIEKLVAKQKTSRDRLISFGIIAAAVILSFVIPLIPHPTALSKKRTTVRAQAGDFLFLFIDLI